MRIIHTLHLSLRQRLLPVAACFLLAAAMLLPMPVQAAATAIPCDSPSFFFIDSWSSYFCAQGGGGLVIDDINDFTKLAFWAIDSLLKLSGYIAAGFVVWGGVKYIKSQGDASQIASAKNTILQAIIGLVICIASIAIVQFIGGAF